MKITQEQEIILDVLMQACHQEEGSYRRQKGYWIDNDCLSAYERATQYLYEAGLIKRRNGRMYFMPYNDLYPKP